MCESCTRAKRLALPKFATFEQRDLDPHLREMNDQIRRMVDIQVKYQNARLEMDIIRVLARFPWYLHVLAKNPRVWAVFKRGV